jgi:hypothetical protein
LRGAVSGRAFKSFLCFHDPREWALLQRAKGRSSAVRKYRLGVLVYGERTVRRAETVTTETIVETRIALEARST